MSLVSSGWPGDVTIGLLISLCLLHTVPSLSFEAASLQPKETQAVIHCKLPLSKTALLQRGLALCILLRTCGPGVRLLSRSAIYPGVLAS